MGTRRREAPEPNARVPKKDDLRLQAVLCHVSFLSNLEDSNDAVAPIDDDDLIADDEVHEPAPFRMDLDEHRRHRDDAYALRHSRSNRDGEVDVGRARTAAQYGLTDLGALLGRQRRASALSLAFTLGFALSVTLALTLSFALALTLSFALALTLALTLSFALARGLIAVTLGLSLALVLVLTLRLSLALVHVLTLGLSLALVHVLALASRLLLLAALLPLALLALFPLALTLLHLAWPILAGASAARLASSHAGLASAAGLTSAGHILRRCQGNSRQQRSSA
jgi:hypothetical protein